MNVDTKSSRRRVAWGAAAAAGLALVVAVVSLGEGDRTGLESAVGDAHAVAGASESTPHEEPVATLARTLEVGVSYGLRLEHRFEGTVAAGAPDLTLAVEAVVELAPAPAAGADWIAGRFADVHVAASGRAPDMGAVEGSAAGTIGPHEVLGLDPADPAAGFGAPFLLRVGSDGVVRERRFAPELSFTARQTVSMVASAVQLARPAEEGGDLWSVEEAGARGTTFRADYRRGAEGHVTKRWRSAGGRLAAGEDDPDAPIVAQGETVFALRDGRVERAEHAYRMKADLTMGGGATVAYTSSVDATLRRLADRPGDSGWAVALSPGAMELQEEPPRAAADGVVPPRTERSVDTLLAEAAEAARAAHHERRDDALLELAAHMRADDAVVDRIARTLRTTGLSHREMSGLVKSMATADTPHAMAALGGLVRDREVDVATRQAVATTAAFVPRPTPALLEGLWSAAANVRTAARDNGSVSSLYALGSLGGFARMGDVTLPDGADVEGRLLAQAEEVWAGFGVAPLRPEVEAPERPEAQNPDAPAVPPESRYDLILWLDALGNLGGERVYPLIQPFLSAEDEIIRAEAVDALRWIPTPTARMAIVSAMANDVASRVRSKAVAAAHHQPRAAMTDAVVRALRTDPEVSVRLKAAYVLAVWSNRSPALLDELIAARERETDPNVRQMFHDLLPVVETMDEPAHTTPILEVDRDPEVEIELTPGLGDAPVGGTTLEEGTP